MQISNKFNITFNMFIDKLKIIKNKKILIIFCLINFCLLFFTLSEIHASKVYITLLSILTNLYLYSSFEKKIITFHFFLSLFFWLGFWFKLVLISFDTGYGFNLDIKSTFVIEFSDFQNYELINQSLLVSIFGILGFYCSLQIQRFFFPLDIQTSINYSNHYFGMDNFIKRNKKKLLLIILLCSFLFFFLNINFNIFQKGVISNFNINFFFSSIFKWLSIFGFAAFSSIIIFHTFKKNSFSFSVLLVSILENLITSIGMLSRGMFVNSLALIFGLIKYLSLTNRKILTKKLLFLITLSLSFFLISIIFSHKIRNNVYFEKSTVNNIIKKNNISSNFTSSELAIPAKKFLKELLILFKSRFVGFEEVFYVVQNNRILSFNLLKNSFLENYNPNKNTFFDDVIKKKIFLDIQSSKNNIYFINVPGIIAFTYYSGSFVFVFFSCFIIGLIILCIEKLVLRLFFNNLILSSIISQTLAYRLVNFGYIPAQTHLLLLAIVFNLIIFLIIYEFFKSNKIN